MHMENVSLESPGGHKREWDRGVYGGTCARKGGLKVPKRGRKVRRKLTTDFSRGPRENNRCLCTNI